MSKLQQKELEEVLKDIVTTLSNMPLTLDRTRYPVFSFNTKVTGFGSGNHISYQKDLKKRQKYKQRPEESARKRRRSGYLTQLQEKQKLKHNKRGPEVRVEEVVAIKGNRQNKLQWKLRIITEAFSGRDGKMRALRLRAGKLYLE